MLPTHDLLRATRDALWVTHGVFRVKKTRELVLEMRRRQWAEQARSECRATRAYDAFRPVSQGVSS